MNQTEYEPCQELTSAKRNNYFAGQMLTERDFSQEQEYHQSKTKQHNRYLHGFGVVCGLRVVPFESGKPGYVIVEPGLALDPWGREIVVPEPVEFEFGEYFNGDEKALFIVLEYQEYPTEMVPSLREPAEESESEPSRILESFKLSARHEPPETAYRVSSKLSELLAKAIREKLKAEQLHALLCEHVSQPCMSCDPDPAVILAQVQIPTQGAITVADIDNCSYRHLALSTDLVLGMVVHILGNLAS
jgi:hypothetical protein